MECKEAQIISIGHIMGDLEFSFEQYQELEAHLASCQVCAEEYESSKWAIKFIEEHKAEFAEALRTPEEKKAAEQEEIERSWKRMEAELDKLEAQERKEKEAKLRRTLWKVTAAAACIAIGISVWVTLSNSRTPEKPTPQQMVLAPAPSIKIELLSDSGIIVLPVGQNISTAVEEIRTLIINDQHRLVMNSNSTLSIELFEQDSRSGCIVKLASGEIFAHVEHDGNPFVVSTAHGKAIITGTTFDVKVTDTITTLVVSEGTVQFEFEKSLVQVKTGQISMIVANSAPTKPVSCNTAELTAWATGYEIKTALAKIKSFSEGYDLTDLWLSAMSGPIDLEAIDYDDWVEEKRDWFKREFPWIFQLKDSLAKEGVEVDYPELLIQSGDVWQFVCLEVSPAQFSVINPDSLVNTASDHGFDKQWLLENVTAAKYALEKPVLLKNGLTTLSAFGQWSSSFENAQNSSDWVDYDDLYSLFHASVYLTETRSLIWFAVRNGQYDLTDKERAEVLALLQKQVNAASICQENALHQPYKKEQLCDPVTREEDKWYEWADVITKNIKAITSVEEKIAEYEIGINNNNFVRLVGLY